MSLPPVITDAYMLMMRQNELSPVAAYLKHLRDLGIPSHHPWDDESGAVFRDDIDSRPGTITGTPVAYRVESGVPQWPYGLSKDENVDLDLTSPDYDDLENLYTRMIVELEEGRNSGAHYVVIRLWNKSGAHNAFYRTDTGQLAATRFKDSVNAFSAVLTYPVKLREKVSVGQYYDDASGLNYLLLNGLPLASHAGAGNVVNSTNDIEVGRLSIQEMVGIFWDYIPPVDRAMTWKEIFELEVAAQMAQYSANLVSPLYRDCDTAAILDAAQAYGNNTETLTGGHLRFTYVDNSAGGVLVLSSTYFTVRSIVIGTWLRVVVRARISSGGSANIKGYTGSADVNSTALTEEFADYEFVFQTTSIAPSVYFSGLGSGEYIEIDSIDCYIMHPIPSYILLPPHTMYGPDLFDNGAGTFGSGTYGWTVYGANTLANVSNALEVTYVDDFRGAYDYLQASSDTTVDLIDGQPHLYETYAWVNTGSSIILRIMDGVDNVVTDVSPITNTSPVKHSITFTRNTNQPHLYFSLMGAGEKAYLTNQTLRQVYPDLTGWLAFKSKLVASNPRMALVPNIRNLGNGFIADLMADSNGVGHHGVLAGTITHQVRDYGAEYLTDALTSKITPADPAAMWPDRSVFAMLIVYRYDDVGENFATLYTDGKILIERNTSGGALIIQVTDATGTFLLSGHVLSAGEYGVVYFTMDSGEYAMHEALSGNSYTFPETPADTDSRVDTEASAYSAAPTFVNNVATTATWQGAFLAAAKWDTALPALSEVQAIIDELGLS